MKTAKEMEQSILEALQQTDHPMKGLIEAVLERWELQIRKDQFEIDNKEFENILSKNPYNQS